MPKTNGKTVSLVLGSGGARGLAHIGVIHWLEESGYRIRSIAGSSMGALVGGIHAAGKLDEYEAWVRAVTRVDILTLLDLSWGKGGLVKGDRIINTLVRLVGDRQIEDLPFGYTAVATDIGARQEVWLRSGLLFDAIRASISIPLFFTPFKYQGTLLVDGGVLNPVPVDAVIGDGTDMILAVNLNGPDAAGKQDAPNPGEPPSPLRAGINRFIERVRKSRPADGHGDWGAYDVAMQSFEAMQGALARQKLADHPPDMVIEIARNACRTLEFDRASEMIELGYDKARECLSP